MANAKKGTYKIGDKVQLNSGGPIMSVEERLGIGSPSLGLGEDSDEKYRCQWFAGKKLESGIFPVESLIKAEEKGGEKKK